MLLGYFRLIKLDFTLDYRDKIMTDKLIYITNNDTQNYWLKPNSLLNDLILHTQANSNNLLELLRFNVNLNIEYTWIL